MIEPKKYEWAEKIAIEKLKSMGRHTVYAPTYHLLNSETKHLLSNISLPTSLFIRTLPDLISISTNSKIPIFLVEVKSWTRSNIAIEALQFGINKLLSNYDIKILYLAVKAKDEIRGRFVQDIPMPKLIIIPTERWNKYQRNVFKKCFMKLFPNSAIKEEDETERGSKDPYFLILEKDIEGWMTIDELKEWMENKSDDLSHWM